MKLPTLHILTVTDAGDERDDIVASYVDAATPDAQVVVHLDEERRGIMWNWLNAAEDALEHDTTEWSIIMQDDAVGLRGWRQLLPEALWFAPAPVLGMSHFGQITDAAHRAGVPYMVGPHLIWGAAVAYRRDFLTLLVPWARRVYEETGYPHDDRLVSAFAEKIGAQTALTTRALFDQPVEKSTVGHSGGNRRPGHTILEPGAHYGVRPRTRRKSTGGAPEQREWLRNLFTEKDHPTHTFKVIRSGAVTWAPKEQS